MTEHLGVEPFDRYRRRVTSVRSQHGVGLGAHPQPSHAEPLPGDYFTAERLLELAWKVSGATMAAIGVAHDDLAACGALVAPTINGIVSDYGVTIPDGYRR